MTPIEFDNFSISPVQEKDAWRLCDFVVINSERLKVYFPETLQQNLTPTLAEFFVTKKTREFLREEEFLFTIKENTNRTIVGLIFIKELQKVTHQGELVYCIGYQYENKGITTKAVERIIEWSFKTLKLDGLKAVIHNSNSASQKVAKKNGFKWVQTLPKEHKSGTGELLDMELYELHNLTDVNREP